MLQQDIWRRGTWVLAVLAMMMASPLLVAGGAPEEEFSNGVASQLLEQVTRGFITDNPGRVLAAFDGARMRDYGSFRGSLQALFGKYESFRAAYRLRQSWPQGERGVVIVEFELEGEPRGEGSPPLRRNAQLRFEFERGRNGWRIVDVAPREFFS